MRTTAKNVGVKAIELYFPNHCVAQEDLEKFDEVSPGKYTVGLGQSKMSFCDDREDIYSLALTTLSSLLRKFQINPTSIGRLEVGTETLLDKSKSIKTVLMQLFAPSGNTSIEGIDTVNACYGGTSALFNSIDWLESSAWDGRDAIAVACDIALYNKGAARPTGGAGCVAMLIGPDAPLAFEPGLRGSYMRNVFDFYKPDFATEYPVINGKLSIKCYMEALDQCYKAYTVREESIGHHSTQRTGSHDPATTNSTPLDRFDFVLFHSPTCRLVRKSYGRLLYCDYLRNPENPVFKDVPSWMKDENLSCQNKDVENTFMRLSETRFDIRVLPSLEVPSKCGNMYTASVYSALVSLISNVPSHELEGKRVAIFSYGSGLASSLFSLRVRGSVKVMADAVDLHRRLHQRRTVTPQFYNDMCLLRERLYREKKEIIPQGIVGSLAPGTYYLTGIDKQFRRSYQVKL